MRKLYKYFRIFHFQKRIVSVEAIRGNIVLLSLNILVWKNIPNVSKLPRSKSSLVMQNFRGECLIMRGCVEAALPFQLRGHSQTTLTIIWLFLLPSTLLRHYSGFGFRFGLFKDCMHLKSLHTSFFCHQDHHQHPYFKF